MSTLVYIMKTIRSGFLLTPIRMTLNDLELLIHLKVRLADGTLDVRMLWQLTRWFSAVAELLVFVQGAFIRVGFCPTLGLELPFCGQTNTTVCQDSIQES